MGSPDGDQPTRSSAPFVATEVCMSKCALSFGTSPLTSSGDIRNDATLANRCQLDVGSGTGLALLQCGFGGRHDELLYLRRLSLSLWDRRRLANRSNCLPELSGASNEAVEDAPLSAACTWRGSFRCRPNELTARVLGVANPLDVRQPAAFLAILEAQEMIEPQVRQLLLHGVLPQPG